MLLCTTEMLRQTGPSSFSLNLPRRDFSQMESEFILLLQKVTWIMWCACWSLIHLSELVPLAADCIIYWWFFDSCPWCPAVRPAVRHTSSRCVYVCKATCRSTNRNHCLLIYQVGCHWFAQMLFASPSYFRGSSKNLASNTFLPH